jgi:hypothetical protein
VPADVLGFEGGTLLSDAPESPSLRSLNSTARATSDTAFDALAS